MAEIDYEKCKTSRPGLYVMLILVYLYVVFFAPLNPQLNRKLDEIKQMQPCKQEQR